MNEATEISPPRPKKPLTPFRVVHGVVKMIAILVGLPLTVISLMALIGLATDNFWIRFVPAVVVALAAPLFIVERLLPDDDQPSSQGLPTDTLAVFWLGFAVLFIGLGQPFTGGLIRAEAQRYVGDGEPGAFAQSIAWLGGPVEESATTDSSTDSETDASPDAADAAPTDASANPDATEADAAAADASAEAGDDNDNTTKAGKGHVYSPADLFQKSAPAVVSISVKGPRGEGSGSGFFIDDEGTIATNEHVVRKASGVSVKLIDGSYATSVELLLEDESVDLALLRVKVDSRITPLSLGDSGDIVVGEPVICIGNPLGLEHTLSDGLISSRRRYEGRNWVQMTAPISPGNSGGPVLNMRGEVVGIAAATINRMFGGAQNLNLAVPVNILKGMLSDDYPDRRKVGAGPRAPSTW